MDQILQQLLDLLLPLFWGALPTVLVVFFLFFFLRWAFWRPFERVLAERQAATEGARKYAETILSTASEKLHQYEEALRQARAEIYRETPDLILTDLHMPGMDGLSLLERVRGDLSTRDIPVVFLTGVESLDAAVQAYDLGADDYISKPIQQNLLLSRLRRSLLRAHLLRAR